MIGKVRNFCKRSQEGVKERRNDRSFDFALRCIFTKSNAYQEQLAQFYQNNKPKLETIVQNEKVKVILESFSQFNNTFIYFFLPIELHR